MREDVHTRARRLPGGRWLARRPGGVVGGSTERGGLVSDVPGQRPGHVDAAGAAAGAADVAGPDPAERPEQRQGLPRRFLYNVVSNYAVVVATGLSGLVVTPVLIHHLGTRAFGVWALAAGVLTLLELFEFGFGAAAIKLMAEDAGRRPDRVAVTLNTNAAVLCGLGVLALVTGAAVSVFAPAMFSVGAGLRSATVWVFLLASISLAVSIPADVFGGTLTAHQRYDLLSLSNLVLIIGTTAGTVAVALTGGGLVELAAVVLVVEVGVHPLRYRLAKRLVPGLRLSRRLVDRGRLRLAASTSGWFLLRDLSVLVINRIDLFVVGILLGVRATAIYAVGLKMAQLGTKALKPLTQVFFPHASALSAARDRHGLAALFIDGTRASLLAALPLAAVLVALPRHILGAWLGSSFGQAATVLIVLAAAGALVAVSDTAWWILAGAGWIRVTALVSAVEAVVNIAVSVALARSMGPVGVAVGTLVGVTVVGFPASLVLSCRLTGVDPRQFLRRSIGPHVLPVVAAGLLLVAVRPLVTTRPVPVLAAAAATVALYALVYLLVGASPAERRRVYGVVSAGWRRLRRRRVPAAPALAATVVPSSGPVLVAVCICTYRRPVALGRLLTVLAAELPATVTSARRYRVRVVVVDNDAAASGRPAVEAARAVAPWPLTYRVEPRRGIAQARNAAVAAAADADLVAFVDDDEVPAAGWLPALLQVQEHSGAAIVQGASVPAFAGAPPRWLTRGRFFGRQRYRTGTRVHHARASNVLIRADLLAGGPPFEEALGVTGGEDTHFSMRAHLAGAAIVWADEACVTEHVPPSRVTPGWLLRRAYRKGNTLSFCLVDLQNSTWRRAKRLVRAGLEVALGIVLVPTALVLGRPALLRAGQRVWFAAGLVTGLYGRLYAEYERVHGE